MRRMQEKFPGGEFDFHPVYSKNKNRLFSKTCGGQI